MKLFFLLLFSFIFLISCSPDENLEVQIPEKDSILLTKRSTKHLNELPKIRAYISEHLKGGNQIRLQKEYPEFQSFTSDLDQSVLTIIEESIEVNTLGANSSFSFLVQDNNELLMYNYIVRENESGYIESYIVELDAHQIRTNISSYTGEITFYSIEGTFFHKTTLSNGNPVSSISGDCPEDPGSDPGGGTGDPGDPNNDPNTEPPSDPNSGPSDGNTGGEGDDECEVYAIIVIDPETGDYWFDYVDCNGNDVDFGGGGAISYSPCPSEDPCLTGEANPVDCDEEPPSDLINRRYETCINSYPEEYCNCRWITNGCQVSFEDWQEDIWEEENIDYSELPDCLINLVQDLISCDCTDIGEMVRQFGENGLFGNNFNLVFNTGNLNDGDGAETAPNSSWITYTITFDMNNNANHTNLSLYSTISHEVIHAILFFRLYNEHPSFAFDYGNDYSNVSFAEVFDLYVEQFPDDYQGSEHHNFMANKMVSLIGESIEAMDGYSQPSSFYWNLAWSGLRDTNVWHEFIEEYALDPNFNIPASEEGFDYDINFQKIQEIEQTISYEQNYSQGISKGEEVIDSNGDC